MINLRGKLLGLSTPVEFVNYYTSMLYNCAVLVLVLLGLDICLLLL